MKKIVVYSVFCGSIEPFNPSVVTKFVDNVDYVLFTDRNDINPDGWEIRKLASNDIGWRRASRRPKLLPHHYFIDYEWSLYLDNRASLEYNPLDLLDENNAENHSMYCFKHPSRESIYDEAEAVISMQRDSEHRVREQMDFYRSAGYPSGLGLIAGTMLLRRHNDVELIDVSEIWFEHVLRYSMRDQLSFNYIAWRKCFQYGEFEGSLTGNRYMKWPVFEEQSRLPSSFSAEFYSWLHPAAIHFEGGAKQHYMAARKSGRTPLSSPMHWELRRIANKYRSDKGDMYYNAHNYADIYEYLLKGLRNKPIRILELGLLRHDVQALNPDGPYDDIPSLSMWREYFPQAEIYGFDIADFSTAPKLPNVTVIRGDMGSDNDLRALIEISGGGFDIIIDDASHASHHQQFALSRLFTHLTEGGIYFIEDLHFQPPSMEVKGITKTQSILKQLACGEKSPTQYIGLKDLNNIYTNTSSINFFDSGEKAFGTILPDALVAMHKGRREPIPSFIGKLRHKLGGFAS